MTLGVGVIGLGHWGPIIVRNFAEHPDVSLISVCDTDARARANITKLMPEKCVFSTDAGKIFADPHVEAVAIVTPARHHSELTKRAIKAGKHVFCEKPLAFCAEDIDEILRLADKHDRKVMVDYTFLFNNGIIKLKEYIDGGTLGTVYYIHATRTHLGLVRDDVDVVWDLGSHDVAIMNYLLNEAPERASVVQAKPLRSTRSDVAFIGLQYPSGVLGQIHVSWLDPIKTRTVQVVGSDAHAVFDDINNVQPVRLFHSGLGGAGRIEPDFGAFRYLVTSGDIVSPKLTIVEPVAAAIDAFVRLVRDGDPTVATLAFARDVVRTLTAVMRSVDTDGALQSI